MSVQQIETGVYAGIGFAMGIVKTLLEVGFSPEALINGMLGAVGAILVKELYSFIKDKLKQRNENHGKVE